MVSLLLAAMLTAGTPTNSVAQAVSIVRAKLPAMSWSDKVVLVGDFTSDGAKDVALIGVNDSSVTVAVVVGPVTHGSRILSLLFPADSGKQDGICGPPRDASIAVEQLGRGEGCSPGDPRCEEGTDRLDEASRRGGRGIALLNHECDAFHIFYDGDTLVWTRS